MISKGTFDLEPEVVTSADDLISVRQISHLASLTMCLWLRFLDVKSSSAWTMAYYEVTGSRYQYLRLMWSKMPDRMELLVMQRAWTGASHLITASNRYYSGHGVNKPAVGTTTKQTNRFTCVYCTFEIVIILTLLSLGIFFRS